MQGIDVVCMGAAIVDIPLQPVTPAVFENDSNPIDQISMTIGGDAINEATIINRLGHKTALVAMVGNDGAGAHVLNHCDAEGIDRTFIKVKDGVNTSINIGLVQPGGERTFITNRNGSLWKTEAEDFDLDVLAGSKLLSYASFFNNPLVTGEKLVPIFKKAKEQGLIICADMIIPRLGETLEDIREALSYVDYFFPNRDEAVGLAGVEDLDEIADAFLACGVGTVIVKTGSKGCFVKNSEQRFSVDTIHGADVIDTIGAGDNFASGFITALLDGKSLEQCAQFANTTANLSVRSVGSTTGVKCREQVEREFARAYA